MNNNFSFIFYPVGVSCTGGSLVQYYVIMNFVYELFFGSPQRVAGSWGHAALVAQATNMLMLVHF